MPDLQERRSRVFMPAVGCLYGAEGLELVRGSGSWVWDRQGRRYLDLLSGVGVTSLGHCHPRVVAAAGEQLATLQHTTSLFLSELVVSVAERLMAHAPGMRRVFFCADGSGAVEGALVAARRATGRRDFLAFDASLHGRTSLTMAATGLRFWGSDPFPPPVVHHLPTPTSGDLPSELERLDAALDRIDASRCAAMIAEPVLGNGGVIVPPRGYFRALRERLAEKGTLLIVDEVQSGLCRTGKWFAIDHAGVVPDLVCVSKALANGLPAAAWLCTEEVASAMTSPMASTFGGNLVCMAAANAVLQVMEEADLPRRVETTGARLAAGLQVLADEFPTIQRPRGLGLMLGVPVAGGAVALDQLLRGLREEGIIAGKCGRDRDVLLLEPSLLITDEEAATALTGIRNALGRLPA